MKILFRVNKRILFEKRKVEQRIYNKITLSGIQKKSFEKWSTASIECFIRQREDTLRYIRKNLLEYPGIYTYKLGGKSLLYASCYAALTLDLFGELANYSKSDLQLWANYILSFQCDDGIFRDPAIRCEKAEEMDWWGFRHLTLHALMALIVLGHKTKCSFRLLEKFRNPNSMANWLKSRNWINDLTSVGNEIQNYATFLQYARDYQDCYWCQEVLDEMFDWLDSYQDPMTGLWGNRFDTPRNLSEGVQTGYHLWLLYFYDHRNIQYSLQIIDSCLATQNSFGGFGVQGNSSACEDIDSIDILMRFYKKYDYRREDIRNAMEYTLPWIMGNQVTSGGFLFRRNEPFFLHENMSSDKDEPTMFPTWFRTLSLAYVAQVLSDSPIAQLPWHFTHILGHQLL